MKKLILIINALCLLTLSSIGQINFEKSYPSNTNIYYAGNNFENKIQYFDAENNWLYLYNPDHSLWKRLYIPSIEGQILTEASLAYGDISASHLFYSAYSETSDSTIVYNNDGDVVLKAKYNCSVKFVSLDSTLVLYNYQANTNWIYSSKGELQHAYPSIYLRFMDEEDSRKIRYAYCDNEAGAIVLYNRYHERVDSIPVNHHEVVSFLWISDISHTKIDSDMGIEVMLSYFIKEGDIYKPFVAVMDEDGSVILNEEGYGYSSIFLFEETPEIFMITGYYSAQTKVYYLSDLSQPFYTNDTANIRLAYFNGKGLYQYILDYSKNRLILSSDWFNTSNVIELDIPPFASFKNFIAISNELISNNNSIEIAYTVAYPDGNADAIILNENGEVLLTLPDIISGSIVTFEDEKKLMAYHATTNEVDFYSIESEVTSIANNREIDPQQALIALYPNPAKETLHIKCLNNIDKLEIYDISGQLIKASLINGNESSVNVNDMKKGVYFLHVVGEQMHVCRKFIVE